MPEILKGWRTEAWLALVILALGALWSALTPYFLTVSNMVDILETCR